MLASAVSLSRINEPPGHGLKNNYGTARGLAVRQGAVIQRTSAVTTEIPADTRACLSCFCPRAADKAMYLCLCPPPSLTAPPPPCACSAPPRAPSTQTWPVAAQRHNYTFLALLMAGYLKPRPRWPEEDLGWPKKGVKEHQLNWCLDGVAWFSLVAYCLPIRGPQSDLSARRHPHSPHIPPERTGGAAVGLNHCWSSECSTELSPASPSAPLR